MANIPISALPYLNYTSYLPTDLYPVVNNSVTKNTTLLDLQTYILSGISTSFTGNTSATCINDLYVDNLHGCNDLTIVDDTVFLSDITANTITINNGQKVRGNTSTAALDLKDPYGLSPNSFSITSDNGGYASGAVWFFGGENYYIEMAHQLTSSNEAIGFGIYSSGTTAPPFAFTGKEVTVHDNKVYSVGSGNFDKAAVFVGTKNSTMDGGIVNSVVIGGQNLYAQENDTVYVDKLNINTVYTGTSLYNLGIDSNGFVVTGSTSGGSFTGGTVSGETIFTGGLSATTFSATTIGASGNCVLDLYVYNIHTCSPLNINPNDEGNVYFGSTSAVTIDLSNNFVGIGVSLPTASLHVNNSGKSGSTAIFEDSANPDSTPFVIDNTGKVGIGLLSPTEKLHILGNDASGISIRTESNGSSWGGGIIFNNSFNNKNHLIAQGGPDYNNSLFFKTSGGTYLTQVDENGNFRIGYPTSSAIDSINARLNVRGTGTTSSGFALIVDDSNGLRNLVVRNDGNVGVGNDSPTAKLDITGSTGYNQLRLRASFTPSGSTDTSGNVGDIAWDNDYFYWKTNGNGWLRASGSTW